MPPPESDLTARLRDRIVSGLHRGRLRGGDRLPSLREVAEEFGADHRAVAAAYRTLESEGLAEVRGRSGVYVAEQERIGGLLLSETGRWLATVMAEAWKRQIMIPELPDLLRQCAGSSALRCAFVESTEDHMVAFCAELKPAFGIECVPVYLTFAPGGGELLDGAAVQAQSAGADIVLTTAR
jgi:DNA-binding transcriptional regulator YhcF (GntR family)